MTDQEHDELRRQVKHVMVRLAEATDRLIRAAAPLTGACIMISQQRDLCDAVVDARKAVAVFDEWKRRAAGPEDLARLDVAMREDAEIR